ncbi:MAG: hypothetical protein HY555_04095 [Euryarchaeota archaeon]|nr:hypothetical protein [Euryarchaeota archaeon]
MRRKKWSEENVIEEIIRLYNSGEHLSSNDLRKNYTGLLAVAIRYFGGWGRAIEAAGLDYTDIRKKSGYKIPGRKSKGYWNKERIVGEIKDLQRKDEDLSDQSISIRRNDLRRAGIRHFGSWRKALESADVDYSKITKKKYKYWDKNSVKESIKKIYDVERGISYKDLRKNHRDLYSAAVTLFGDYKTAVESAGYEYHKVAIRKHKYWTKDRVLSEIKSLKKKGVDLSSSHMMVDHNDVYNAGKKLFGSWKLAIQNAGIDYYGEVAKTKFGFWTKELMISFISELESQGIDLSSSYIQKHYRDLFGYSFVLFGGWRQALEVAGFDYSKIARQRPFGYWTTETVISNIKELVTKNVDLSVSSIQTIFPSLHERGCRLFGSWEKAIIAAGFNYDKIRKDSRLENYKGLVFEKIVEEIFESIGRNVQYQKRFLINDELLIPDFSDTDTGAWIDVKLRSWSGGTTETIQKYLKYAENLEICFLIGDTPKYNVDNLTFKSVKEYVPILKVLGRKDIIRDLTLLEKGIIPSKYQKELEDYSA